MLLREDAAMAGLQQQAGRLEQTIRSGSVDMLTAVST
jgi:hypothetical protein